MKAKKRRHKSQGRIPFWPSIEKAGEQIQTKILSPFFGQTNWILQGLIYFPNISFAIEAQL